jgi:hypothetical protein
MVSIILKNLGFPKFILSLSNKRVSFQSHTPSQMIVWIITLKFKDEPTFDAWCEIPEHDKLLDVLHPYRSRDYFEAVRTDNEIADPSTLNWETYNSQSF